MYIVIYCSFIFSVCIFIFYFSSEILAKFSYSVNPRLNKVYVCMYACMHACMHACKSIRFPALVLTAHFGVGNKVRYLFDEPKGHLHRRLIQTLLSWTYIFPGCPIDENK